MDFSATYIDHIFIRDSSKYRERHAEIGSGTLYCEITDYLPSFVKSSCSNLEEDERPLVRLYVEKMYWNSKSLWQTRDGMIYILKPLIGIMRLSTGFIPNFSKFFVWLSRKRRNDKPGSTKGIKLVLKEKHHLYESPLRKIILVCNWNILVTKLFSEHA